MDTSTYDSGIILHICRDIEYRGGVEVVLYEFLCHNLDFRHILVTTEGCEGERARRLLAQGVYIVHVTGSFRHKVRAINAIIRGLSHPPILHCHLFRPECLGFFLRGCRTKVTTKYCTYASDSQIGRGLWGRLRRLFDNQFLCKIVSLTFSDIIVITDELGRMWRWLPGNLYMIEVSTLKEYAPPPPPRIIGEDMTLIVGTRMVREKDHGMLIEALRHIRFGKLYMFGDGPLRGDIAGALLKAGVANVEMLGAVPRHILFSYMKRADAMLLTSCTEGLPLLIQEAMSLGLIVVATNVGGNSRLVDDVTGRLVYERTPEAFAAAVNSLIGCDASVIGRAAIERSRRFSLTKTINSINRVYRGILRRAHA